jgi:hypothetical protein
MKWLLIFVVVKINSATPIHVYETQEECQKLALTYHHESYQMGAGWSVDQTGLCIPVPPDYKLPGQ